jgi:hypothetical protein
MLEPVDIVENSRRALRRAVSLECDVLSELWDEPVAHRATNLSECGIWLEASLPLDPGDSVVMSFTPPHTSTECVVTGLVRRVELYRRAGEQAMSGMAIEFVDLEPGAETALAAKLRGLPPPLPRELAISRLRRDFAWVETLLTFEEIFDDRVNVFEVSELLGIVTETPFGEVDVPFEMRSLAPLLTGANRSLRRVA